jgi:hypothetical protein
LALVALASAHAAAAPALGASDPQPDQPVLTFSGGLDLVTSYYWRGYLQEDAGVIAQPYLEADGPTYQADAVSLTPFVRTWNSLHSKTGADAANGTSSNWYQSDLSAGVKLAVGALQIMPSYTLTFVSDANVPSIYSSPDYRLFRQPDRADTVQEASVRVAYDDTKLMQQLGSPVTLQPFIRYCWQTTDDALASWPMYGLRPLPTTELYPYPYTAYQRESDRFQYIELGLTPAFRVPGTALTLGLPLVLGMSPDGLYRDFGDGEPNSWHNILIGYWSVGIVASVPLARASQTGRWTLTAGVTYLRLEADSVRMQNGGTYLHGLYLDRLYAVPGGPHVVLRERGSPDVWIGKLGVAFEY